MKKAQTPIEYLIVLAVVIIIALIVVGIMGGLPFINAKEYTKDECYDRLCQSIGYRKHNITYFMERYDNTPLYDILICENSQYIEYRIGIVIKSEFNYTTCKW